MDQPVNGSDNQPIPQSQPTSSRNVYKILSLVFGFLLFLLLAGGAYLMTNKTSNSDDTKQTSVPTETSRDETPVPSLQPTTPPQSLSAAIIIESESTLPSQDVTELKNRVVNPYVDYFKEARPDDQLASFKITKNTQASAGEYPYLADAISKKGVNESFVIRKENGHIAWWTPECMMTCTFSDSFKAKYPEVVAAYPY